MPSSGLCRHRTHMYKPVHRLMHKYVIKNNKIIDILILATKRCWSIWNCPEYRSVRLELLHSYMAYMQKFLEDHCLSLVLFLLKIGHHPLPASQDPLAVHTKRTRPFLFGAFASSYVIEFTEELFAFGCTSWIIIRMLLAQNLLPPWPEITE